jgi:hypothetical protein
MIAGRLRRRGFLNEEQYRMAIGAPAPDTTRSLTDWFFGPQPDSAPPAQVPVEPPAAEPEQEDSLRSPAPDTSASPGQP